MKTSDTTEAAAPPSRSAKKRATARANRGRRVRRGRPTKWDVPLERVQLHVPPAVRAELDRIAGELGCSISEAAISRIAPHLLARAPLPARQG